MALEKQVLSLAAGATSAAVLTGTTYETLPPGRTVTVAAAHNGTEVAGGAVTMNFNMNNTELARNAAVSKREDAPFGYRGDYILNQTVTPEDTVRSRPIITFTNNTSGTISVIQYAVHIV
jgi:hypothetical protein